MRMLSNRHSFNGVVHLHVSHECNFILSHVTHLPMYFALLLKTICTGVDFRVWPEDLVVCNIMYRAFVGLQFFPHQLLSNTSVNYIWYLLLIHLGVTWISSEPLFYRHKHSLGCSWVAWEIRRVFDPWICCNPPVLGFIKLQTVFYKLKLLLFL